MALLLEPNQVCLGGQPEMERKGSLGPCLAEFDSHSWLAVMSGSLLANTMYFAIFSALPTQDFRLSLQPFVAVRTVVSILNVFRALRQGPSMYPKLASKS